MGKSFDASKVITKRNGMGLVPKDCLYMATYGEYDLDCKVGYGSTPEEAIENLKWAMDVEDC